MTSDSVNKDATKAYLHRILESFEADVREVLTLRSAGVMDFRREAGELAFLVRRMTCVLAGSVNGLLLAAEAREFALLAEVLHDGKTAPDAPRQTPAPVHGIVDPPCPN